MHFLLSVLFAISSPQNVSLQVSSTAVTRGDFHLAVYANASDYEARRPLMGAVKACNDDVVSFEIDLPDAGHYVISGYHDLNGNGKLDFNMMGIPKEPYGFVQPPVSKWKEPQFEEIATAIDGGKLQARLDFKLWKEY